jgi:hypothetical protein
MLDVPEALDVGHCNTEVKSTVVEPDHHGLIAGSDTYLLCDLWLFI